MPTLYATADGALYLLRPEDGTDIVPAPTSAEAPIALRFDATTNPDLAAGLRAEWAAYRVSVPTGGGPPVLLHNGGAVTIAPPGPAMAAAANAATLEQRIAAQIDALRTLAAQLDAASKATTTLTLAQVTTQLRQTQGALAAVTLATLRLIRLAARQLDALD